MFKCPHCGVVFNEPVTKSSIIDENTGEEVLLPKEMRMRVCPYCNKKFVFDNFKITQKEKEVG